LSWLLQTTASFDRQARKFLKQHPDLRSRLGEVLAQLQDDPFHPTLKLHALTGKLDGLQAIRINFSYRVVLTVQMQAQSILLLDIGSHDAVYK
jgi:mRNA-degrading endonuclease YafQ of YafQ-DinJ toxin-antitoxin module